MSDERLIQLGKAVLETESKAVQALIARVGEDFVQACRLLLACAGRVVVSGMGKSGHIARKIAATLASTGTPAFFVHPGEASHGDSGMMTEQDVVIAISHSGETGEILEILPVIKRLGIPLISLTGEMQSTLARASQVVIDVSVQQEACPLGLAPTASTTAALSMGDALAVALLEVRGFTAQDFALSHPGGRLGKRLLLRVSDIMHTQDRIPWVPAEASLKDALTEMSQKGLGMTGIVDENKHLLGIFTDGDLRRVLDRGQYSPHTPITQLMTRTCRTVSAHIMVMEALQQMQHYKINGFLVLNDQKQLLGAFNMHDLLRAGVL